ncbi:unnamed protein product [Cuscuta campestris]|uniref:Uncharacterized protein n=1 Tax=Cuscuta campestris TaxID=132261 RepID=A0A484NEK9_9ASTE|nr:unnamed protein product [Cuscuta campestris]
MFLQLGSVPTLVVSTADAARAIFRDHDIVFSGRPPLYAGRKISYNCADVTFSSYGEYWLEVRKVLVLELLSAKRALGFAAVREAEVGRMIDRIALSCSPTTSIDFSEAAMSLANGVVCRAAFGKRRDGGEVKFQEILQETQNLLGEPNLADFFPKLGGWMNKVNGFDSRLEKNCRDLDRFLNKVMEEHLDELDTRPDDDDDDDIVHSLLRIQRSQNGSSVPLTTENIKAVLLDVFVAGSDTSASTIVWTMTELMKNPNTMRKAQSEVRQLLKGKQRVNESDLPNLDYLKMVLKESFRLHPPAPLLVPRETTDNCTVCGYDIPAKTRVFINAMSIGRDPRTWENPSEFWPERFEDGGVDYRGTHFELIPFGVGRRGCPGINFAVPLVELALANLLYRFDWHLPAGVEDVDMEETFGITVHKKTPLCLLASLSPSHTHN